MPRATRDERLTYTFLHVLQQPTCSGYLLAWTDAQVVTITCLRCGMTSTHPNDIAEKYCGHCHVFHNDPRR